MKLLGKIFVALAIITIALHGCNAFADSVSEEGRLDSTLKKGSIETATEIVAGDLIKLQDGRIVKIAGVEIPDSYAVQAKKYLHEFSGLDRAPSAQIRLYYGTAQQDRYGRIIAYPYSMDWLGYAEALVQQGFARAQSTPDTRAVALTLLGLERESRGYGNELWKLPEFAVLTPEKILDKKYWDRFQIVEGRVRDVAEIKKTIYLNFGDDWKTDFTAVIPVNARAQFTAAKIKVKDLKNISVRVRGFVHNRNGPSIELTHPELLEILEPAPTAKPEKAKRTRRTKS